MKNKFKIIVAYICLTLVVSGSVYGNTDKAVSEPGQDQPNDSIPSDQRPDYPEEEMADLWEHPVLYSGDFTQDISTAAYIPLDREQESLLQTFYSYVKINTYYNDTDYNSDYTFVDGIGRPMANVSMGSAMDNVSDIIVPVYHDAAGRKDQKVYLPFSNDKNLLENLPSLYENQAEYNYGKFRDNTPYYETVYDGSPLGRVAASYNVGDIFRRNDKKVTVTYDRVVTYMNTIALSNGDISFGFYKPLYFLKTTETDEDGLKIERLTDSQGKLIMETKIGGDIVTKTQYVYDKLGRLIWVLTPQFMKDDIIMGTTVLSTDDRLQKYCYYYRYDDKNRLVEKKLPGVEPVHYVYDQRNRLAMSQDGNQAPAKEWFYYVYDNFDRLVEKNIVVTTYKIIGKGGDFDPTPEQNREYLQDKFNKNDTRYTGYVSSARQWYAKYFYVELRLQYFIYDGKKYTDVRNWDDLDFVPVTGICESYYTSSKGQPTYEAIAVIDGSSRSKKYVYRRHYYDDRDRLVQTVEKNQLEGISRYVYQYDYLGNIISKREIHNLEDSSPTTVDIASDYIYNSRGRLISEFCTINNNHNNSSKVTYHYDEVGAVLRKTYADAGFPEYIDYNIQGWRTYNFNQSSNSLRYFNQATYEIPGVEPSYTGKIMEWSHSGADAQGVTYTYKYDGLGRLAGEYNGTTGGNAYTENGIMYDLNGNMIWMARAINRRYNNYTYSHDGNKMNLVAETDPYGATRFYPYEFDKNGNRTKDGLKNVNLKYNSLNLLDKISSGDRVVSEYRWLGNGTKASYLCDGIGYEYIGSMVYSVNHNTGTVIPESVPFSDGRFQVYISNGQKIFIPEYYTKDHLGSTRSVLFWDASQKASSKYYPHGKTWDVASEEVPAHRYLFNGKEIQSIGDIGYLDYGARMYDPATARWLQPDPLAENHYDQSPYLFAGGDPVNNIDPDGRDWYSRRKKVKQDDRDTEVYVTEYLYTTEYRSQDELDAAGIDGIHLGPTYTDPYTGDYYSLYGTAYFTKSPHAELNLEGEMVRNIDRAIVNKYDADFRTLNPANPLYPEVVTGFTDMKVSRGYEKYKANSRSFEYAGGMVHYYIANESSGSVFSWGDGKPRPVSGYGKRIGYGWNATVERQFHNHRSVDWIFPSKASWQNARNQADKILLKRK